MKIIDAFWEKRNLGVSCSEVEIENGDLVELVKKELSTIDTQYTVLKVPSGRTDIILEITRGGYFFIEASLHLIHKLGDCHLNGIQERLAQKVDYQLMNEADIRVLFSEIASGMFNTDRISLDPYFSSEQSAKRYIGWISDELDKGTSVFKLIYKNETVGFFTFKDIGEGVYYPFLAGIYSNYAKAGIGFTTIYKPIFEALKKKGKMISTYVSTNNLNAMRMHEAIGFFCDKINYVFIKHS